MDIVIVCQHGVNNVFLHAAVVGSFWPDGVESCGDGIGASVTSIAEGRSSGCLHVENEPSQ